MRDRWLILSIVIVVVFVLWRASYVPPGYETIEYETVPVLPAERYDPPILEIWEAMENEIPFDNRTARLMLFDMRFDANGSLNAIQFCFTADMEGEPWAHSAFVLRNGSAYLSSQRIDFSASGPHPLGALAAVENVPFDEIPYGKRGVNLNIFCHEENRTYDDTYGNIYAALDGTLRPLKEISFATPEIWHTVEIYPYPDPAEIDPNLASRRIDEIPEALVVFAPREIGLAERVAYAETDGTEQI